MRSPSLLLTLVLLPATLGCLGASDETPAAQADDEAAPAAPLGPWEGTSGFGVMGACGTNPLDGDAFCVGRGQWNDGTFELSAPAEGLTLEATWKPVGAAFESVRVVVALGEEVIHAAEGPSPLVLALPALDAGTYAVGVRPSGNTFAGAAEQSATWTIRAPA